MQFRPAGTHGVLVSIWDTRVSDFQAFVTATGYDATQGVLALDNTGWHQTGANWSNPGPGFDQRLDDPVLGVSWNDAVAFCQWLTKKEQSEGRIGPRQFYRLPTDVEWTAAAGTTRYPWGDNWPPPIKAGNYLRQGDGVPNRSELRGTDGYPYASPVGSFTPNVFGLYDMGGNVWQWVDDWYRRDMTPEEIRQKVPTLDDDGGGQKYKCARGASFFDSFQLALLTTTHDRPAPDLRQMNYGFRCVLVVSP
jgi:formylglycine-generating enzyme required for sulfatase activity